MFPVVLKLVSFVKNNNRTYFFLQWQWFNASASLIKTIVRAAGAKSGSLDGTHAVILLHELFIASQPEMS